MPKSSLKGCLSKKYYSVVTNALQIATEPSQQDRDSELSFT